MNVYLGIKYCAYARGIPIITIAERESDISTTLQGISEHLFLYQENEIEGLTDFLLSITM